MDIRQLIPNLKKYGLSYVTGRYYSKLQAQVHSNEDPESRGRLQLIIHPLSKNPSSVWAYPCGMAAAAASGFYLLPQKGDFVYVEFVEGNSKGIQIWTHGWWGSGEGIPGMENKKLQVWQSYTGQRIEIDDESKIIRLTHSDGNIVEVNKGGISLGKATSSSHPGTLGDNNADLLDSLNEQDNQILQMLATYCGSQATACTTMPLLLPLAPGYAAMAATILTILEKYVQNKIDIPGTKSKIVTTE